jgi:modulator of FtsH protease
MERVIKQLSRSPVSDTHKVLRNTYCLLGLTLAFSALVAAISTALRLPSPGLILTLFGFYGLMFLTHKLARSPLGILTTFAFTGFLGYSLGPMLGSFLALGMGNVIVMSLGGTALVFFCCSAYALTTKRDMSFIGGMMMTGSVVLILATIANIFLHLPALHLTISVLFILFSAGAILWETSSIISGGERNYILATISLYVSLYNIFVSLLSLLGFTRDE